MNAASAQSLTLAELFQLMHFYAEAGVDTLLEDEPQDRFAEFATREVARAAPAERPPEENAGVRIAPAQTARQKNAPPPPMRTTVAIPDAEAAAEARRVANSAVTLDELAAAVAAFTGCNLRNSARSTVFMRGNPAARIAVAAGAPGADDDRDGQPFAGAAGAMLQRMLAGIGIAVEDVMLFNLIPWRPAGDRPPTPHEVDICRPFGTRLVELLAPTAVLALGNFPARFFSGSAGTIHALRGQWMDFDFGERKIPVMATFHPQDLAAAPASKRLVWQDLLAFSRALTN